MIKHVLKKKFYHFVSILANKWINIGFWKYISSLYTSRDYISIIFETAMHRYSHEMLDFVYFSLSYLVSSYRVLIMPKLGCLPGVIILVEVRLRQV